MNLTVFKRGSQSQRRLLIDIRLKREGRPSKGIAQSHQPIGALLLHAATHKRALPAMETPLGDALIVLVN